MHAYPILTVLTFLPLLGVALIALFAGGDEKRDPALARRALWIGLGTCFVVLGGAVWMLSQFDPAQPGFQMMERHVWIPSWNVMYIKGVDGLSALFVGLVALIMPVALLCAFSVRQHVRAFVAALLVLEAMMIGVFTSLDFVLFYLFFEGVLIPMFLVIGIWGGEKRIAAAMNFFLYSFAGSVLMLLAILYMSHEAKTTDMTAMMERDWPLAVAMPLWLGFCASFAIKTPLWPFHTWLPQAHSEAPTAGSVLLAGLLLKMGGYGFIRIGAQMLPQAQTAAAPTMMILGIVGIVYALLAAMVQTDMKRLIAYTSIAHMGFAMVGLFSGTADGYLGAVMVMLSHGFVAAGLFAGAGVLYDRTHSRDLARYGQLAGVMPRAAFAFMLVVLGAIGLPGTSGFVGEFLAISGAVRSHLALGIAAGAGLVLGAAVMLRFYGRLYYGAPAAATDRSVFTDLSVREMVLFVPLIVPILGLGMYPAPVMGWLHEGMPFAALTTAPAALSPEASLSTATSADESAP